MIQINNLSHIFPNGKVALDSLDLHIKKSEFVVIAGRNGSGKSTLVRHMNALLLPSVGTVIVNGMESSHRKNHWNIRQAVSMVFQNPDSQFVGMTVEEDVAFGLENLVIKQSKIKDLVNRSLQFTGLSEYKKTSPMHLSGGQKQKVAIASVLAMDPECIIFDEVTSMLDASSCKEVMDIIEDVHKAGKTVIHVTHRLEEATKADRLIIMDAGRIVLDDTPSNIFQSGKLTEFCLEIPPMVSLAKKLMNAGVLQDDLALSKDELLEALCHSISRI